VTECDPVITLEIREDGKPVTETVSGVPEMNKKENRFEDIIVTNGDPGLKNLEILINGEKFKVTGLKDGEEATVDVSYALVEGEINAYELTAFGKPGCSAVVVIPVKGKK
jgi:hypothetical protein